MSHEGKFDFEFLIWEERKKKRKKKEKLKVED
jgi:hypothetical protein